MSTYIFRGSISRGRGVSAHEEKNLQISIYCGNLSLDTQVGILYTFFIREGELIFRPPPTRRGVFVFRYLSIGCRAFRFQAPPGRPLHRGRRVLIARASFINVQRLVIMHFRPASARLIFQKSHVIQEAELSTAGEKIETERPEIRASCFPTITRHLLQLHNGCADVHEHSADL